MRKKIIFLLFFCCLAKLYHIADRRMDFSLDLLINSFTVSAAEQSSLGQIADDVVLIKNIFLNKNVSEFMLSEDKSKHFGEFKEYTKRIDSIRGTNFKQTFPEFAALMEK